MNTISTTTTLLTHSLGWALVHSLWQGLLIYAALWLLLRAMPNISAANKYRLSLGAFAGMFVCFADTWLSQYRELRGTVVYITSAATDGSLPATYTVHAAASNTISDTILSRAMSEYEHYLPAVMTVYCIGLALMVARLTVSATQATRLRKTGITKPGIEWQEMLARLSDQLGISKKPNLMLSARITVPVMMGVIKPVILLPVAAMNHLNVEQVEAILMHELAHIRRNDYLVNILQGIGEAVLFFNPFVWLISTSIRRERELCCDDLVVASAASPLPYAKALALLEHSRGAESNLALATTGNKNQLFHRIKRIMEMKKKNLSYSQLAIIITAIIAVTFTAILFTFTPSMAQKTKSSKTSDTTAQKKSVYHYKTVIIDDKGNKTVNEETSDKPIKHKDAKTGQGDVTVSFNDADDSDAGAFSSRIWNEVHMDSPDVKKIMSEVRVVTKDITKDVARAMAKVQEEMGKVDWDAIGKEIEDAVQEVDKELSDPKLRKEIKEEIEKELAHSRHAIDDAKNNVSKRRVIIENRSGSGGQMEHTNFDEMLTRMEDEGLIDRAKTYAVKGANGELYINGTKQPAEVYDRYRDYLDGKTVTIKGKKGSLNINISK